MSDMREGVCPKCGSREVYYDLTFGTTSRFIMSYWKMYGTKIHFYVCATCGYLESYVLDKTALSEIADRWQRADGRKKKNDES